MAYIWGAPRGPVALFRMAYAIDPTGQARKARTLTATDPATGQTVTRRTDRVYVAAVVYTSSDGKVYAAAWAGRPDLAAKALEKTGVGSENGYRLAPVTSDPWATPEPEPTPAAPATPEPEPTPDLVAAVAPAPLNPAGGLILLEFRSATPGRPYLAGDGVTLWAFETEALARAAAGLIAATGATPYLAGPGPQGRPEPLAPEPAPQPVAAAPEPCRPLLPGEPLAAPAAPEPGGGLAAHRAAAAAGRPVSLAALSRDLGRGRGLSAGGRIPSPSAAPTGDPIEGLPWDPGTPEARARHAEQGRLAALLHPIARAATGAGHSLPPIWWPDGPILNGEVAPMRALKALPLPVLFAAAAALAALPPVTTAQAEALAYCRAALRGATAAL